jgi:hypothetical protein
MAPKTIVKRKPSRPSSITQLDPKVKEAVDTAVREGRASIDEIVELIKALGGDASRSAVGRYVKSANERMEEYREAQQMAAVWMDKIGKDPQGDVGRLNLEMLRMLAFKGIRDTESASPKDLMFLGAAVKSFAQTDKLVIDTEFAVRKLVQARAAEVAASVVKTVKKAGLSTETINVIRAEILGIPEARKT